MLQNLQKRKSEGFTIIEVLIVLAIAGLIMVVVFLAVPALQRSQRNQSRKTDVNNLISSIADFTGNNGGTPPATQTDINTTTSNMKLAYLKSVNVFYGTAPVVGVSASNTTPAVNINTTEEANVFVGYICTSATAVATNVGATARSVAVQYVLEQASGPGLLQCVSS